MTCDMSVVFTGSSGFLHHKNDRHDITEILLKVALIIIEPTNQFHSYESEMAKLSEIDSIFNSVLTINAFVLSYRPISILKHLVSFYDYPRLNLHVDTSQSRNNF